VSVDVVKEAERIVSSLDRHPKDKSKILLTTSQLRKFLAAVNGIENRFEVWRSQVGEDGQEDKSGTLPPELVNDIKFLKVKLVYQAGREKNRKGPINGFIEKSKILERIDAIGNDAARFQEFARLVEAIVAYHKFQGGGD